MLSKNGLKNKIMKDIINPTHRRLIISWSNKVYAFFRGATLFYITSWFFFKVLERIKIEKTLVILLIMILFALTLKDLPDFFDYS